MTPDECAESKLNGRSKIYGQRMLNLIKDMMDDGLSKPLPYDKSKRGK
jgi:hypothetical protein